MQRIAVIDNNTGLVENIGIGDALNQIEGKTCVFSAVAKIGDTFDGQNFSSPEEPPAPEPTVLEKIVALEKLQTPRRLRDAILGVDNGWLANIEAEISALREQL